MFGISVVAGFAMERLIAPVGSRGGPYSRKTGHRLPPDHVSGESTFNTVAPTRSFLSEALHSLEPEIRQLKGLAIAKLMEIVEQSVGDALPGEMSPKVRNIIHDIARKMGGDVSHEHHEPEGTSTELA